MNQEEDKMNKDVTQMVTEWLKQNGYDGLYNDDGQCACDISDINPCGEICTECTAGMKEPCECGDGHNYHIVEVEGTVISRRLHTERMLKGFLKDATPETLAIVIKVAEEKLDV